MSSIVDSFRKRSFLTDSLPVFNPDSSSDQNFLRRRLSSPSLLFGTQPFLSSSSSSSELRRSKSVPGIEQSTKGSLRRWWEWGCSWMLCGKPSFSEDLEEKSSLLGSRNEGIWKSWFYKLRSEIRRLMRSDKVGLPQTYRYDSADYAKNFDDGSTRFTY